MLGAGWVGGYGRSLFGGGGDRLLRTDVRPRMEDPVAY